MEWHPVPGANKFKKLAIVCGYGARPRRSLIFADIDSFGKPETSKRYIRRSSFAGVCHPIISRSACRVRSSCLEDQFAMIGTAFKIVQGMMLGFAPANRNRLREARSLNQTRELGFVI